MKKIIVVLFCLCIGVLAVLGVEIANRMKVEALDVKPPTLSFRAARQIFPFSVIPGGVYDAGEVADSITKDVVVREHYRDLRPDRLRFTRIERPMLAYVSYRKGDKVNWTTHPVTIPANELVLTDGEHLVRARCGNRIEIKRPEPLPAAVGPPEVPPPDIAMETGLPALVPPTVLPPVPPNSEIAQANAPPDSRFPTPQTTWCCGIVTGRPPSTSGTPSLPSVPVVPQPPSLPSTPEPPSFYLVCAGGIALLVLGGKNIS